MNDIKKESLLFNTALKYKESLIYVFHHTKIYKFLYDEKIYYFKINTKQKTFGFTENFFSLLFGDKDIEKTKEDFKLNKKNIISFFFLKDKESYYSNTSSKFYPLLDLLFSVPLNGRPRKYFQNSFGKIKISSKEEKLTGYYKKIIDTDF